MVSNIIYDDTELFCTLHKQISIAVILGKQNKTVKSIEQEKNTIRHTWPILSLNLYHSNSSISPGAQGHYNYELKASTSALMCWKSDRNLGRGSFLCQSHFKTAGCERRRRSKPYPAKKKKVLKHKLQWQRPGWKTWESLLLCIIDVVLSKYWTFQF